MTVETFTVGTRTVTIKADSDTVDPREDFDHTAVLALSCESVKLPNEADVDFDVHESWKEVEAWLRAEYAIVALLPVYGISHGRVAIRAGEPYGDPWDSGQAGFAFVTNEAMKRAFLGDDWTTEQAEQLIRSEVEEYNQYLLGEVYGYEITDADGTHLDSCWGMYGLDYCRESATEAAEQAASLPGVLLKGDHRVLDVIGSELKPGDVTLRAGLRVLVCAARTLGLYTVWEVKDPATGLAHEHQFLDDGIATHTVLRPESV